MYVRGQKHLLQFVVVVGALREIVELVFGCCIGGSGTFFAFLVRRIQFCNVGQMVNLLFVPVGKNGIRVFEVRLMQTCHGALACLKDDVRVKTVLVRPAADISDLGGNQLASGNAERVHHGVVHFAKNRGTLLGLLDGRDMLICPAKCDFFYVSAKDGKGGKSRRKRV